MNALYKYVVKGLFLLVMLLLPWSAGAAEQIFWLKSNQGDIFANRRNADNKAEMVLMEGDKPADTSKLKVLEAGWWCYPFAPARQRTAPPPPRYYQLAKEPKLKVEAAVDCRVIALLRFEKDNKIYTVQNATFLRGSAQGEEEFLQNLGAKAPAGPGFDYPKMRIPSNGGINMSYLGVTSGSKVARGYDEQLVLENEARTNEKNILTYIPNEIERLEMNNDNRLYLRHLVIEEKDQGKEYVTTVSTFGMRSRRRFVNRPQGVALAVFAGLLTAAGCVYLIRRREKHVNR